MQMTGTNKMNNERNMKMKGKKNDFKHDAMGEREFRNECSNYGKLVSYLKMHFESRCF